MTIGCQLSVSTNSARGSFGLSYTSPSPEGGTTRVGITHAGLFTIIVRAGGRTNTVTVPTPMGCVPGCGDPTLAVIKDMESTLFHMARKRREPSQAGKRAGYPGCEQGSALLHNKIWNAFKEKNKGMKNRPYYVIGFGIGLISKIGYEAAEFISYR